MAHPSPRPRRKPRHLALALPLALVLAACGTPQQQCISAATRDLKTVDRLLAETEANIARGFAYQHETVWDTDWVLCPQARGKPGMPPQPQRMCLDREPRTITTAVAIDLDLERRKAAGLREKKAELTRLAEADVARCRAQYPE